MPRDCCSRVFTATTRIVGREAASQIASASAASFFCRFTNGFTYKDRHGLAATVKVNGRAQEAASQIASASAARRVAGKSSDSPKPAPGIPSPTMRSGIFNRSVANSSAS